MSFIFCFILWCCSSFFFFFFRSVARIRLSSPCGSRLSSITYQTHEQAYWTHCKGSISDQKQHTTHTFWLPLILATISTGRPRSFTIADTFLVSFTSFVWSFKLLFTPLRKLTPYCFQFAELLSDMLDISLPVTGFGTIHLPLVKH